MGRRKGEYNTVIDPSCAQPPVAAAFRTQSENLFFDVGDGTFMTTLGVDGSNFVDHQWCA